MNDIFNTNFEVSLRITLLLYALEPSRLTIDRVAAYDFIAINAKSFGIGSYNLHGENVYSFSELTDRREKTNEALKELVLNNIIKVQNSFSGFIYSITAYGESFAEKLDTDYAIEYANLIKKVQDTYREMNDEKLVNEITKQALKMLIKGEK